ncbi:hypothetical protein ykris0001_44170 [Yersinia kristensenii ATCC 33638]|nr:hypothetical protein ykris0001_44170 [Yersinia kristensenii ATCC 33638]
MARNVSLLTESNSSGQLQVKSLLPAILADNEGEIVTFKSGF